MYTTSIIFADLDTACCVYVQFFFFFETEPENPFYLLFWCGFILLVFSLLRIVSTHCYVAACLEYYSRSSREVMLLHGIYFWVIFLHITFQISSIYNMMHGMRYCRQKRCLNQNCNKKKKSCDTRLLHKVQIYKKLFNYLSHLHSHWQSSVFPMFTAGEDSIVFGINFLYLWGGGGINCLFLQLWFLNHS